MSAHEPLGAPIGRSLWSASAVLVVLVGLLSGRAVRAMPALLPLASGAQAQQVGGSSSRSIEASIDLLEDPRAALAWRRAAAAELARPELGLAQASLRARALAERVRKDPAAELRQAALAALALVEGAAADAELASLVLELPAAEADQAARLLVARPSSGRALLDLLQHALAPVDESAAETAGTASRPAGTSLEVLVGGLGRAFADVGREGDRGLFILARLHPEDPIRAAAAQALEAALERLGSLRLDQRAIGLLETLAGSGWNRPELLVREAIYLIQSGRELESALAAAERVELLTRGRDSFGARRQRFFGAYLEAAALLGLARPEECLQPLMRASLVLDGLAAERLDLSPDPVRPSVVTASRASEVLELRGLVDLMAATCALAAGAQPGDAAVLQHLAMAHEFTIWSQLRLAAVDENSGLGGFDLLLDSSMGPRRLVLASPDNPNWSGLRRGRAIDLMLALGRAAVVVAGPELPGFEPPSGLPVDAQGAPRFVPPLEDPRRSTLLKGLRPAQLVAIQRRLGETWDQGEMQMLELRRRALADQIERDREDDYASLDDLRLPSTFALQLAEDLRAEDRAEEAVALLARLMADLDAAGRLEQGAWGAWLAARIEIAQGGALGDAGRPREAIVVLDSAVRRLEAVENTIGERKRAERDPRAGELYDRQLKETQRLRAQALVGQAVNSNVRLGDAATALVYFEAAYALDDSDFMRGLLACYRARFGAEAEARALLRTIRPAPDVYYNLACAHALLGDDDAALEMLRRELEENHPTPGSLERQRRWARGDPDLANLLDDPRFLELVGAN